MSLAGLSLVAALSLAAGGSGADEHLLAGARLFRSAQYPEALVEFRVAEQLGDREAAGYAGATLVKLQRHEEAIEAFGGVAEPGPDPLLDYYRALAAYEARLYGAAERLLGSVAARSGPKIAAQALKLRDEVAAALATAPTKADVDWYRARCAELRTAGRRALSEAFCQEASALAARRPEHGSGGAALDQTASAGRGVGP